MRVTVLAVGRLSEKYWAEAAAEYLKRLSAFCKPAVVEIPETKFPSEPSEAEIKKALETESKSILSKLPPKAMTAALCVEGAHVSSEELADMLTRASGEYAHIALVIGGSHGLSPEVKARADIRMSISKMTFPHQLCRVMLLEQIYRGFSINKGMRYHK